MFQWKGNNDKLKLAKYKSSEVTLSEEQHKDMNAVVNKIEEISKDELGKIFAEGDSHCAGTVIREIWTANRREQLDRFNVDQARNSICCTLKSQTHNVWFTLLVTLVFKYDGLSDPVGYTLAAGTWLMQKCTCV